MTVHAPADFAERDARSGAEHGSITLLFDRRSGNLLSSKLWGGAVTTPLESLRYREPHDHVTVVHTARFTGRIG